MNIIGITYMIGLVILSLALPVLAGFYKERAEYYFDTPKEVIVFGLTFCVLWPIFISIFIVVFSFKNVGDTLFSFGQYLNSKSKK